MELTQLKQFKTIAETENISEAANILYVTQPALSNSLNKLETELGVRLFDRSGKKITLNEYGSLVLETVNSILETIDCMCDKLHDTQIQKNIKFGTAIVVFIYYILPIYMCENTDLKIYPQIISQENIPTLFKKNMLDCAITSYAFDTDEFCNIPICTDYAGLSVDVNDTLSEKKEIFLNDLENRTFATFPNQNPLSNLAKEVLSKVPGIKYIYNGDLISSNLYTEKSKQLQIYASSAEFIMPMERNRVFIPFAKEYGIKMTYYFVYKKEHLKADKLNSLGAWVAEYFKSYNNQYDSQDNIN